MNRHPYVRAALFGAGIGLFIIFTFSFLFAEYPCLGSWSAMYSAAKNPAAITQRPILAATESRWQIAASAMNSFGWIAATCGAMVSVFVCFDYRYDAQVKAERRKLAALLTTL